MSSRLPHTCLFVLPSLRVGGAEKVVIRIANALAASGLDVGLTAIDGAGELRRDVAAGVPIYELGVKQTRYAPFRLIGLIRQLRPAVVFSSLTRVSLLLLLVRPFLPRHTRIIVRQPSIASTEIRTLQPLWLYKLLFPRLIPTADAIVSLSRVMTADLRGMFGEQSDFITMINNPAPEIDRNSYLAKGSPFGEGVNFLAVCRLSHEKGPDLLLRAFSQAVSRLPAARLTILGDGPLMAEMRELAIELGIADRVTFRGFVPDPFAFYVHADALVLASRYEGFPNVLVEAMACGTPAVATDCGGVSAEIILDGDNGFVVPGENAAGLAEAMVRVITLRRERSAAAIAQTAQRFSPAAVYSAYRRLIQDVAGTASASRTSH